MTLTAEYADGNLQSVPHYTILIKILHILVMSFGQLMVAEARGCWSGGPGVLGVDGKK